MLERNDVSFVSWVVPVQISRWYDWFLYLETILWFSKMKGKEQGITKTFLFTFTNTIIHEYKNQHKFWDEPIENQWISIYHRMIYFRSRTNNEWNKWNSESDLIIIAEMIEVFCIVSNWKKKKQIVRECVTNNLLNYVHILFEWICCWILSRTLEIRNCIWTH